MNYFDNSLVDTDKFKGQRNYILEEQHHVSNDWNMHP